MTGRGEKKEQTKSWKTFSIIRIFRSPHFTPTLNTILSSILLYIPSNHFKHTESSSEGEEKKFINLLTAWTPIISLTHLRFSFKLIHLIFPPLFSDRMCGIIINWFAWDTAEHRHCSRWINMCFMDQGIRIIFPCQREI